MKITVGIPTRERYESLSHTLLSMALQTLKPYEIIIVDDTPRPVDLREIPIFLYIFKLLDDKGIKWRVLFGKKLGQHHSHQMVQEIAETEWIFRIDDDEVAEPNVLAKLAYEVQHNNKLGAVAPAVLMPNANHGALEVSTNKITEMDKPNIQWFKRTGQIMVEHLYSCFLYRKGIVDYDLRLSPVAHREETIFSHSIYRSGWKLLVNFDAVVHHFRAESGGIRSERDVSLWEHDERIFQGILKEWQIDSNVKYIVLDCGIGDHYAFKNILPQLREQHKEITIACCYPDVFHDEEGLHLISIAQAKLMFGNIDKFNVYRFMEDNKWEGNLVEAFEKLYL